MIEPGAHLDSALVEAVREATQRLGQPESAARRLIAWLDQLSLGESTPLDSERFLAGVLEELRIPENDHAS